VCLSKAWFRGESTYKAIIENIARIGIENGKLILTSLFGKERIEKAIVKEVDFTHNSTYLKEIKLSL
jgi:hypothetical protein